MAKPIPEKLWVKAAPGRGGLAGKRKVAREGSIRRFITEQEPVEVALSAYYLRKLASGELVRCAPPPAAAPTWSVKEHEPAADRGASEED